MMNSKLLIPSILVILDIVSFANEPALTTSSIRSFPLQNERLSIRLNYNRINDTIDFLDIKEKELGNTENFGSIGNSNGLDLSFAYGVNDYYGLFYNYEHLSLNYIDNKLKNNKNEFFLKATIYKNPMSFFETLSADLGYVRNSADNLDIKDNNQLNTMIQKIKPISGLSINGSIISYKGNELQYFDSVTGKPISPFIQIGDMKDNSFYLRLLTGFHYRTNIVDIYAGLKYTSINTTVSLEPHDAEPMHTQLSNAGYHDVDLNRNEKTAFFGLNYTVEFSSLILDLNYEYLTIWGRDESIKKTDDNHIFNSSLSYIINKNLLVFIGGKLMLHQFNGVIPYLYNKYTKNKYTKKYGYAKVGFVYNFDTSKLFNNNFNNAYTNY